MKKILISLFCVILLVSCSNEINKDTAVSTETTQLTTKEKNDGYYYKIDDLLITTGEEATAALELLGEPVDSYKAPSCAFEGEDTVYQFKNIELYTFEKEGKPYISGIFLLDDSAQTAEGLKIGSTVDEMKTLYGTEYEETAGSYVYSLGKTELIIVSSNDKIISISYILKV